MFLGRPARVVLGGWPGRPGRDAWVGARQGERQLWVGNCPPSHTQLVCQGGGSLPHRNGHSWTRDWGHWQLQGAGTGTGAGRGHRSELLQGSGAVSCLLFPPGSALRECGYPGARVGAGLLSRTRPRASLHRPLLASIRSVSRADGAVPASPVVQPAPPSDHCPASPQRSSGCHLPQHWRGPGGGAQSRRPSGGPWGTPEAWVQE